MRWANNASLYEYHENAAFLCDLAFCMWSLLLKDLDGNNQYKSIAVNWEFWLYNLSALIILCTVDENSIKICRAKWGISVSLKMIKCINQFQT